MPLPQRKRTRLEAYDYATPGAYFVTICTHEKRCILSDIAAVGEGLAPPAVSLSTIGRIVEEQLSDLPRRFPSVSVDRYVIMPNHVHLLLSLSESTGGASPSPTLTDVICVLKSMTTRLSSSCLGAAPLWQRSFHDHVVRGQRDYDEIWKYIEANPARWRDDRFYPEA